MQALLEVKEGERPYKMAESEWMKDGDGPFMFRVISKQRKDGQIELVCYTLRGDGIKRIVQHISFAESDFWKIMETMEYGLKQFFPDISFNVQNIDVQDTENLHVLKNTKFNRFHLYLGRIISAKIHSIKARIFK